jgi:hypothetical protein
VEPSEPPAAVDTPRDGLRITFKTAAGERQFALAFHKTDSIKTAKIAVAKFLGIAKPESLRLRFRERELMNAFILERIRIGSDIVVVEQDALGE